MRRGRGKRATLHGKRSRDSRIERGRGVRRECDARGIRSPEEFRRAHAGIIERLARGERGFVDAAARPAERAQGARNGLDDLGRLFHGRRGIIEIDRGQSPCMLAEAREDGPRVNGPRNRRKVQGTVGKASQGDANPSKHRLDRMCEAEKSGRGAASRGAPVVIQYRTPRETEILRAADGRIQRANVMLKYAFRHRIYGLYSIDAVKLHILSKIDPLFAHSGAFGTKTPSRPTKGPGMPRTQKKNGGITPPFFRKPWMRDRV